MKPVLILGLGNDLLADDRFGPELIDRLVQSDQLPDSVEAEFVPLAGFGLLDYLQDRKSVLIVDAIQTGKAPVGTLHLYEGDVWAPTQHLCGSHQVSLPTAIEFGRLLGYNMPDRIDILAAEADDVTSLSQEMTPAVEAAVDEAAQRVHLWIESLRTNKLFSHAASVE